MLKLSTKVAIHLLGLQGVSPWEILGHWPVPCVVWVTADVYQVHWQGDKSSGRIKRWSTELGLVVLPWPPTGERCPSWTVVQYPTQTALCCATAMTTSGDGHLGSEQHHAFPGERNWKEDEGNIRWFPTAFNAPIRPCIAFDMISDLWKTRLELLNIFLRAIHKGSILSAVARA